MEGWSLCLAGEKHPGMTAHFSLCPSARPFASGNVIMCMFWSCSAGGLLSPFFSLQPINAPLHIASMPHKPKYATGCQPRQWRQSHSAVSPVAGIPDCRSPLARASMVQQWGGLTLMLLPTAAGSCCFVSSGKEGGWEASNQKRQLAVN